MRQFMPKTPHSRLSRGATSDQNLHMIKASQIFDWDQEPSKQRASGSTARLSEFSGLDVLDPIARATGHFGVNAQATPEANRTPPKGNDLTLSALVPGWLESLVPDAWPSHLCTYFPRIANRLALCWADPELTVLLLDEFFMDRRGTRRGFPAEALEELRALRQLASRRLGMKIV
jgi:hypothetical protein